MANDIVARIYRSKMRGFLLFGPSGIGKSTVIAELKARHYPAFDAETIPGDRSTRKVVIEDLLRLEPGIIIGAGDLDPKVDLPIGVVKVLLTAKNRTYLNRRRERDKLASDKLSEAKCYATAWENLPYWDYRFDTTYQTAEETAWDVAFLYDEYEYSIQNWIVENTLHGKFSYHTTSVR